MAKPRLQGEKSLRTYTKSEKVSNSLLPILNKKYDGPRGTINTIVILVYKQNFVKYLSTKRPKKSLQRIFATSAMIPFPVLWTRFVGEKHIS